MPKENKKTGQEFYIVPQTNEEIERNREMIEELRAKGLLQKHEKTFKLNDGGIVTEENE